MKYQVLFFLKNKEKYSNLSSAAVMIGALRAKRKDLGPRGAREDPH